MNVTTIQASSWSVENTIGFMERKLIETNYTETEYRLAIFIYINNNEITNPMAYWGSSFSTSTIATSVSNGIRSNWGYFAASWNGLF